MTAIHNFLSPETIRTINAMSMEMGGKRYSPKRAIKTPWEGDAIENWVEQTQKACALWDGYSKDYNGFDTVDWAHSAVKFQELDEPVTEDEFFERYPTKAACNVQEGIKLGKQVFDLYYWVNTWQHEDWPQERAAEALKDELGLQEEFWNDTTVYVNGVAIVRPFPNGEPTNLFANLSFEDRVAVLNAVLADYGWPFSKCIFTA